MAERKLPKNAYELGPGETYVPLTHGQNLTEFTAKAVLSGIVLGMLFGAANTYLGLKAGLTISTSIPIAVLSVVVFRLFSAFGLRYSILETNLSQTIGSASSSVASGVLFTLPALFLWGITPEWRQITLLAMCGGLLGVLAMVPLRSYLIDREHGKLPYPEGMACAEVLVAAESGGKQAMPVFLGIGFGMFFKILTDGLKLVLGKFQIAVESVRASVAISVSPALIGVGYILGIRVASVMAAGGALSSLVIIPSIYLWGKGLDAPFYPETTKLIGEMSSAEIWNRYVRYIGAGAVATGGFITLIKSIPTMVESFKLGIAQMGKGKGEVVDRTKRDLGFGTVLAFVAVILGVLTFVPGILGYLDSIVVRGAAAILIAIFAFFFVTVSSRIVGLVGVTSNPTSGMTIATLLGTSFVFYAAGWTDTLGKATALMVGTVVCIAASIAGDTSQDLKTGFVLGATPRRQQIGELVGVITSAGVVCMVLMLLDNAFTLGSADLPAPQGVLMQLVIDGVIDQNLPWVLIGIGAALALVAAALRVPVLAFAVGVYLPMYTMAAVFVGGLLRWLLTRNVDEATSERRRERGILFGSGLVGGGGLTGVLLALWVAVQGGKRIEGIDLGLPPWAAEVLALLTILAIVGVMARVALAREREA